MKKLLLMLPLCIVFAMHIACSKPSPVIHTSELLFEDGPFKECHASTIVEVAGSVLVAYFGGTQERNPDVSIYLQRQKNGVWTDPEKVADGIVNDSVRYATWNPVFYKNDHILYLFYKMGPSPVEWWGMYIESFDEGIHWSEPKELPKGILGPIKNKPIKTKKGTILSPSSVEYKNGIWKSHVERSEDNGMSWSKIELPSRDSIKVIQPTFLELSDDSILALLRSDQNRIMQSLSFNDGISWSEVTPSDLLNPNSGIDAVATQTGKFLLVNNSMESGDSWEVGRNKLYLYASNDGKNWSQILKLEDHDKGEYSYPSIIESRDGSIKICYTYNRKSIKYIKLSL